MTQWIIKILLTKLLKTLQITKIWIDGFMKEERAISSLKSIMITSSSTTGELLGDTSEISSSLPLVLLSYIIWNLMKVWLVWLIDTKISTRQILVKILLLEVSELLKDPTVYSLP